LPGAYLTCFDKQAQELYQALAAEQAQQDLDEQQAAPESPTLSGMVL